MVVQVNVTDFGIPKGVPALELWENAFRRLAWASFSFAIQVIIDPQGEVVLLHSDCQILRRTEGGIYAEFGPSLEGALEDHRILSSLRQEARTSEVAADALNRKVEELRRRCREILPCLLDYRLTTARYLTSNRWPAVWEVLGPPPKGGSRPVVREVYPMAIRALGEFLLAEEPYTVSAESHLEEVIWAIQKRGWPTDEDPPYVVEDGSSLTTCREGDTLVLPEWLMPELRRRSAVAMGHFLDRSWDPDDPGIVATATAWWRRHGEEPEYRVELGTR